MKIPAVAIAAAFAGGIVLGRLPGIVPYGARPSFLAAILAFAGAVLCVAVVFAWRNLLWLAASAFLLCWLGLGVAAECLARRPLPPEHILSQPAAHQVPLRTPLRWNGPLSTPCLPKMTPVFFMPTC
jgi:MFS family permease